MAGNCPTFDGFIFGGHDWAEAPNITMGDLLMLMAKERYAYPPREIRGGDPNENARVCRRCGTWVVDAEATQRPSTAREE